MATKTLVAMPPLPKMSRANRPKTNHCACGCGQMTAATFVPGHDSRLRGWMLRLERGIVKAADIPDGERQAAVAALKAAGGHVTPHTRPGQVAPTPKTHDRKADKRARRAARKAATTTVEPTTEEAATEQA